MPEHDTSSAGAAAALSVDVEDWFHILDSPASPRIEQWGSLEYRLEIGLRRLLETFERHQAKATLFWLGWEAHRHKGLVRECAALHHEIASHGYGHVLAYKVGPKAFREDVTRAKMLLEDITGLPVRGFRAPGFGITAQANWAFGVIRQAGHEYDSSVFPSARGHGGNAQSRLGPYLIRTPAGELLELPMSAVEFFGQRLPLFGGGYLRLAPRWLIRLGARKLARRKHPLIVYVHPREADPEHPRLPLSAGRKFKSYVNLRGTLGKIDWLCRDYRPGTMGQLADAVRAKADLPRCDRQLRTIA